MRTSRRRVSAAAILASLLWLGTTVAQSPSPQTPASGGKLSEALAARLPLDWQQIVATVLTIPAAQQKQLSQLADDVLRQTLVRQLVRQPRADEFLRTQLKVDPSPRVRTTIIQAIAADLRWMGLPDVPGLLERAAASDADAGVSLTALETLRRSRMRWLNALLAERLALAKTAADSSALKRLADEQERWISLERGTMLPAFLRTPPPPFSVVADGGPIRVLAFGDFGNGSSDQSDLSKTIVNYNRDHAFDFAITLGDNFYDRGMESVSDPRWQTWFENLYGPIGIPFYATLGNHDWVHPDSPAAEILYGNISSIWRMPASYYTFTAGTVQFFALDTQSIALSEKQLQWLDAEIGRSTATWKIVYGHHPIYSGGAYMDRPDLIAKLLPLLRDRVDVYLCGHDHNLQALKPDGGVRFYVAGGGGAGLYELRDYERSVFASRTNGFAVIEAELNRLTVRMIDGSGNQVYQDVLTKPTTSGAAGRLFQR